MLTVSLGDMFTELWLVNWNKSQMFSGDNHVLLQTHTEREFVFCEGHSKVSKTLINSHIFST